MGETMKLQLNITKTDGTEELVPVRPRTQVAYERHFKAQLNSDIGMEQLYWLAWHSAGVVSKFDNWLDDVELVAAVVDDGEGDDPLDANQSSGELLPSPLSQAPGSPSTS